MNTRLIRFLFGAIIALAIALSLLVLPMPTRAAPTASTFTVNTQFDGVNANACANNTPGQCTLREAILEANATSGATIILPGLTPGQFYYVAIPPSGPDDGTTGDLHVNSSMNIVGKPTFIRLSVIVGASLANDRVFNIGSGVTVNISNVTIRNGAGVDGGGIYNAGTLMLTNTTVFSNTASIGYGGGIYNAGTLMLTSSTVISNTASSIYGGGIFNAGTLMVTNSAVSGNATGLGGGFGGISNFGNLTLTNSTISENAGVGIDNHYSGTLMLTNSTISGNKLSGISNSGNLMLSNGTVSGNADGGIYNYSPGGILMLTNSTVFSNTTSNGGGIYNGTSATLMLTNSAIISNTASGPFGGGIYNAGTLTVTNSTVSGNTASHSNSAGGGILNDGAAYLTYVTLSDNTASSGGGIYQKGSSAAQTIWLANTIIANSPSGGNCAVQAGSYPLISNGYNLSSDGTCATYFYQTGDLNNTNPNLGPLVNNGGPTLTHALLPGSPAIDQIPIGINGCGTTITTDQRGTPRPIGPRCDIGAYEARYFYLFLPLIVK